MVWVIILIHGDTIYVILGPSCHVMITAYYYTFPSRIDTTGRPLICYFLKT